MIDISQPATACPNCGSERSWCGNGRNPHGVQLFRAHCIACHKAVKARFLRSHTGYTREYTEKYPLKTKAHRLVNRRVEQGKLLPGPCERCGRVDGVHAHHEDYTAPLDVVWLCPKHHGERHRELAAQAAIVPAPTDAASCRQMAVECGKQADIFFSVMKFSAARGQIKRARELTLLALKFEAEEQNSATPTPPGETDTADAGSPPTASAGQSIVMKHEDIRA